MNGQSGPVPVEIFEYQNISFEKTACKTSFLGNQTFFQVSVEDYFYQLIFRRLSEHFVKHELKVSVEV